MAQPARRVADAPTHALPRQLSVPEATEELTPERAESTPVRTERAPRKSKPTETRARARAEQRTDRPEAERPLGLPGATARTAVTPQSISLPKAEGSIQGMGESFHPNLSSGTGAFSIPIAVPPGRAGLQPGLSLGYSTSGGSGVAGVGWGMEMPFISRQSDRGMARYRDAAAWHAEEDRFIYNGGSELVAVSNSTTSLLDGGSIPAEFTGWQQYRAQLEGAYMRFFRAPDSSRWVVQSPDGGRLEFGVVTTGPSEVIAASSAANQSDDETGRVYRWMLSRSSDAHGSVIHYLYEAETGQRYLSDIYYISPNRCGDAATAAQRRACTAPLSDYGARVHLVYETRPDVLTSYASGWMVQTSRRLKRIEMTASRAETVTGTAPLTARYLVRRYHLGYQSDSFYSLLSSVQLEGRPDVLNSSTRSYEADFSVLESALTDAIVGRTMPAVRFSYTAPSTGALVEGFGHFPATVRTSSSSPDISVDGQRVDLFDVNADGLLDVIATDPSRYETGSGEPAVGVFFNGFSGPGGTATRAGEFSSAFGMRLPAEGLDEVLSLDNPNVASMDIDGDGRSDFLHMPRRARYGYFAVTRDAPGAVDASPAAANYAFAHVPVAISGDGDPRVDLTSDGDRIRVMDVNGDHLTDIVRTAGAVMQTWLNLGFVPGPDGTASNDGKFGSATWNGSTWIVSTEPLESCALSDGAIVSFDDPEIQLADMNADGLQDIVRVRPGRVNYWPGRGPGLWGTGSSDCSTGTIAPGRYITMTGAPWDIDDALTGVHLQDINSDGAEDVVEVGFSTISVWMNQLGVGFSDRVDFESPAGLTASRTRFADIDGSGTLDLLVAQADAYKWVDFLGGTKPRLLETVDNGLGALSSMQYASSAEDYLRDLSVAAGCSGASPAVPSAVSTAYPGLYNCGELFTWSQVRGSCDARIEARTEECVYRSGGSPVISTVVRSMSATDRMDALGIAAVTVRSEFAYHNGYYEGIEEEFRGFGAADAISHGDAVAPTGYARTYFHQAPRPNDIATDRIAENPYEPLKGQTYKNESFDQTGVYASTSVTALRIKRLFTGLDGRAVVLAYPYESYSIPYDTANVVAGAGALSLPFVTGDGVVTESQSVALRNARYAVIKSTIDETNALGMATRSTAWGRIRGEEGEAVGAGLLDERIISKQVHTLYAASESGWLWRDTESWIESPTDSSTKYKHATTFFNAFGDAVRSESTASAASYYDFTGSELAETYVQGEQKLISSASVNRWGLPLRSCAGADLPQASEEQCLRYSETDYDSAYGQFPVAEHVAIGRTGTGFDFIDVSASLDRGLGAMVSMVDTNGYVSSVGYDGLGRMTYQRVPPTEACISSTVPSVRIEYTVTSDPVAMPVSRIRTLTQLSCANIDEQYLESIAYTDGLGRPRAAITQAEGSTNAGADLAYGAHKWVKAGISLFNAKGQPYRSYEPTFVDTTSPSVMELLATPPTAYTESRSDAFGRGVESIERDGSRSVMRYHALSTEAWDALDLGTDPLHEYTFSTARQDGHGRGIDNVIRWRMPDEVGTELDRLVPEYRVDGAVLTLTRAQTSTDAPLVNGQLTDVLPGKRVSRRWSYDTLGRRIASHDPDTDSRDPDKDESNNSWRYLYNSVGDLSAVRDPRGCGSNYYYDYGGRLRGEAYVSCNEAQASQQAKFYTLPEGVLGQELTTEVTFVDAINFYDTYDEYNEWGPIATPPPNAQGTRGKSLGSADRGQRSVQAFDRRGNAIWAARQLAYLPAAPTSIATTLEGHTPSLAEEEPGTASALAYDTAHTYTTTAEFDYANRPLIRTLPSDMSGGTALSGTMTFNARGLPSTVSAEIEGVNYRLVDAMTYTRDGLSEAIRYGDGALTRDPTTTTFEYDLRRRPIHVRTTRDATGLAGLSAVTVPQDQSLTWDAAGNLTAITDLRPGSEWQGLSAPQSMQLSHDGLYRIINVAYTYTTPTGPVTDGVPFANWRDEQRRTKADGHNNYEADPMRPIPAPMMGEAPTSRVSDLSYRYDFLANMVEWTDDSSHFYERSLGDISNGLEEEDGRPAALRFASNLPHAAPTYDANAMRGGYLWADHGEQGDMLTLTVHTACKDKSTELLCYDDTSTTLTGRNEALGARCSCAQEQHYQYQWDEAGRISEARRYDRNGSTLESWHLEARVRYLYDSGNQRTVKEVLPAGTGEASILPSRFTLTVFPGDFEIRGAIRGEGNTYTTSTGEDAYAIVTEYQANIGPSRITRKGSAPWRITTPLTDLLQTSVASLDLQTGELLEASAYYPNGARESLTTNDAVSHSTEPRGFTGKEEDTEVGLTYFGMRYLAPHLGRWTSADPAETHAVSGGEALNSYHYVSGNLLQARDPLGLAGDNQPAISGEFQSRAAPSDLAPKPKPRGGTKEFAKQTRAMTQRIGYSAPEGFEYPNQGLSVEEKLEEEEEYAQHQFEGEVLGATLAAVAAVPASVAVAGAASAGFPVMKTVAVAQLLTAENDADIVNAALTWVGAGRVRGSSAPTRARTPAPGQGTAAQATAAQATGGSASTARYREIVTKANPTGFGENCQFTSTAVNDALAGKALIPAPAQHGGNLWGMLQRVAKADGRMITNLRHAHDVAYDLSQLPVGTRAIVWGIRDKTSHVFNAIVEKGTHPRRNLVRFLDGQTGSVGSGTLAKGQNYTSFDIMIME